MGNFIPIIIAVVLLIIRFVNEQNKKKANQFTNKPTSRPNEPTSDFSESFEDLLEVFTKENRRRQQREVFVEPKKQTLKTREDKIEELELSNHKYAAFSSINYQGGSGKTNARKKTKRFDEYKIGKKQVSPYAKWLKEPGNMKRALVAKEIFDKKY